MVTRTLAAAAIVATLAFPHPPWRMKTAQSEAPLLARLAGRSSAARWGSSSADRRRRGRKRRDQPSPVYRRYAARRHLYYHASVQ